MFEEEFHNENGYDPLYNEEKQYLETKLNVKGFPFEKIELQEIGIDIIRAYEISELLEKWNKENVINTTREKYPFDFAPVILMWFRIVEELSRVILFPIFMDNFPDRIAIRFKDDVTFRELTKNENLFNKIPLSAFSSLNKDEMKHLIHSNNFENVNVVQGFELLKNIVSEYNQARHERYFNEIHDFISVAEKAIKFLLEISV